MAGTHPSHPSHRGQLGRLNRVSGQIDGIKRMIDEGRYCVDIMTQVRAARSALKSIELGVLEAHMESCLDEAGGRGASGRKTKIREVLDLLSKYE